MVLPSLVALCLPFAGCTKKPEMKMHRTQATTRDVSGSGWYYAASTEGSFSALLPIPFNDFTLRVQDPKVGEVTSYAIGSKSAEGLKFSVVETVKTSTTKEPDLDTFATAMQSPDQTVKGIDRAAYQGIPSVAFEISDPKSGAFIRCINAPQRLFMLILEYPADQRPAADGMQERFLNSLQFKKP